MSHRRFIFPFLRKYREISGFQSDGKVQAEMASLIYCHPAALHAGILSGVMATGLAAHLSGSKVLLWAALALAALGLLRSFLVLWFGRSGACPPSALFEKTYAAAGFVFAAITGAAAGWAILVPQPQHVDMLLLGYALAYAMGISSRNIGRPITALAQLALAMVPVLGALLASGSPALMVLAGLLLFAMPAKAAMTLGLFRSLERQLRTMQHHAEQAQISRQKALTDSLTGLANRMGLEDRMAQLPPDTPVAMYWIDLLRFKHVNELLGHQVGDKVLRSMAERLVETTPDDSIIARYAGDDFIIVAPVAGRGDAEGLAAILRDEMMRPFRIHGHRIAPGGAMGIAMMPDDAANSHELMKRADVALYNARIIGRNQALFYTPSMTRDLIRRKEVEAELRAAIQKDELSIFFQPIIDLDSGRIRKFEALVRWFHPTRGEMQPVDFIPIAEETGVLITLGNWITAQAARVAAQWPDDVMLTINLAPAQIRAPGAALAILSALRDAGLPPHRLELEVTEKLFLEKDDNTARFIEDVVAEGVSLALDDFGTGYSSLQYINQYPFRAIKVDRSFVSGPHTGLKSDAIIRAVAEMGATLDMEIVAEGLETSEQVAAMRQAGCTLGQGFYFSRAVPEHLATILLARERDQDRERLAAG